MPSLNDQLADLGFTLESNFRITEQGSVVYKSYKHLESRYFIMHCPSDGNWYCYREDETMIREQPDYSDALTAAKGLLDHLAGLAESSFRSSIKVEVIYFYDVKAKTAKEAANKAMAIFETDDGEKLADYVEYCEYEVIGTERT